MKRKNIIRAARRLNRRYYTGLNGLYNMGVMRMLDRLVFGDIYMSQAFIREMDDEFVE